MLKYKKGYLSLLITIFLGLFLGGCGNKIEIAGDPCTIPLASKLAEAYQRKTGVEFDVQSAACGNGIYKAIQGEVDIGVSTHEVDRSILPKQTDVIVIAKAPTVILVNKKNPVNNLSLEQVNGILKGKIRNWKKVGGPDLDIENVLLQPCTTSIFQQKTTSMAKSIKRLLPMQKGNPVELTNKLVAENEGALGIQIYGYESQNVKVITIDGKLPDESSVPLKYGYYQDYSVILREEPTGEVKKFLDFIASVEGNKIVAEMKHIGSSIH